jgi:endonuclease YncB( thermonuclease family)
VGRVIDGDTIDICIGANCIWVRLCGIDAPERGERGYGRSAQTPLARDSPMRTGRPGTVCDGRSRATNHGRLVAQCFLRGADVGGIMVERGLACDWERFSGGHYWRTFGGRRC